jgi:tetratricopeptide (TPR) repeat protein
VRFGAAVCCAASLAAFVPNAPAAQPSACALGDALADAGLVAAAEAVYASAQASPATAGCAAGRLTTIAERRLAAARALKAAGLDEAAAEQVAAALTADPDAELPPELAPKEDVNPFASAEALESAGYREAAEEKAKEVIAASPTEPVPSELRGDAERHRRWAIAVNEAGPWARTFGEIALVVFLATLLLAFMYGVAKSRLGGPRISVEDFEGGTDDDGKSVAAVLQESLRRLESDYGGAELGMVGKWADPIEIPGELIGAFPVARPLAWLVPLVQRLPLGLHLTVSGRIGEAADTLTVTLAKRSGAVLEQVTVTEEDFGWSGAGNAGGRSAAASSLAESAAVWLMYERRRRAGPGRRAARAYDRRAPGFLGGRGDDGPPLGTTNWRSFALFSAGADAYEHGELGAARRLYVRALEADPRNRGALLNLGTLDLHASAAGAPADEERDALRRRAKRRLQEVQSMTETGGRVQRDPMWFHASYSLAARQVNTVVQNAWSRDGGSKKLRRRPRPDPGELESARKVAADLVQTAEATLRARPAPALRHLLELNEASIVILLALVEALGKSEKPPSIAPATREALAHDPTRFSDADLIAFAEGLGSRATDARYNIACYYATIGACGRSGDEDERYARALDELRLALEAEDPWVRSSAVSEPSFTGLKRHPATKATFERLVLPEAPSRLHRIATHLRGIVAEVRDALGGGDGQATSAAQSP